MSVPNARRETTSSDLTPWIVRLLAARFLTSDRQGASGWLRGHSV